MERSIRRPCICSHDTSIARLSDGPDASTRLYPGDSGAVSSGCERCRVLLLRCFTTGVSLEVRLDNGSRMTRECHVRFWERLEVQVPGSTHHFGMKAHIGVDAESGLVHTVIGTAANVHDINAAEALLHGQEKDVYADAGYQGIEKRCQANPVRWHVAMRPGKRRQLDLTNRLDAIYNQIERLKAGVRAKVEHPFRVLKQQFGYTKTRYRGLMKNTAQITTLFALGNLWMARKALSKA